ncbi:MAG: TonB-dependent receptor [Bacteroidales bacterium]|nr:TonB-dependent receptor [Bacteroidales bacterium]
MGQRFRHNGGLCVRLSLLGGVLNAGAAVRATEPDTVAAEPSYTISEVVVTGARYETDGRHLPMTLSVLKRPDIAAAEQPSLLPLLSEKVPGLFVTSRGLMGYGVSGGAAGGISLRGLGGGSGQLMVLIDGHPQYMGLMGHPIADFYQSYMAEQVEVLRGPASVLYGSNAMGGVINIVTRKLTEDGVRTHFNAGYGSYNTFEIDGTNIVRKGRFSGAVGANYQRSDGHRENMDFEQYGGFVKLGYDVTPHWTVRANANAMHFNASQPGTVSEPLSDADQRVTRVEASATVENEYKNTSGALSVFFDWGDHWINDGYAAGETPRAYRYRSRDAMLGVSVYQTARFFRGNRMTFGLDYFRPGGRAWNAFVAGEQAGTEVVLADWSVDEVAGYVHFRQEVKQFMTLDAGIRVGYHTRAGLHWIPQLGFSFHLPAGIELKLTGTRGYRNPTLRELYMFRPANADLAAESIWNYELAFSQRLLSGRLSYALNVFYLHGDNLIVTRPVDGRPLNVNTGRVRNFGVETEMAYRINAVWSVDANYSYLNMENPVVGAPEHKLYGGAVFRYGRWQASTGIQYIHGLYTETAPVVKENFVLWNLHASCRVLRWLTLWLKGENLLAQKYEINAGYPMPTVTAMGGVRVHF